MIDPNGYAKRVHRVVGQVAGLHKPLSLEALDFCY